MFLAHTGLKEAPGLWEIHVNPLVHFAWMLGL